MRVGTRICFDSNRMSTHSKKEEGTLLTTTDTKTMAYINLFGVLGTLENLCALDPNAGALLTNKKPLSIGFEVKGGPAATITFKNGRCRMEEGVEKCDVKLPFSSCEKFNGLLDGTTTPIPSKGFAHLKFLLKSFVPLTDLLAKYLRPEPEDMKDPEFRAISTRLTLYTAAVAISQVANHDKSGVFSTGLIPDGDIAMNVNGDIGVTLRVRNHHMVTIKDRCDKPRAAMTFSNLEIAGQLLRGEVSAMGCICDGSIAMSGMVNMIDNVNRILDRVSIYLA